MNTLKRKIPLWAFALLVLVYFVLASFIIAHILSPVDGCGTKVIDGSRLVIFVKPGSPADNAGLLPGDIIKKIGNMPVQDIGHEQMLVNFRSGETVNYLIQRDNELIPFKVKLGSLWDQNQWFYISFYLLILIVCSTSLIILYRKPYDITARVFFIFLQLFAIAQNFNSVYADNWVVTFGSVFFILAFNIFGIVLLHFHLLFPEPVSFYRKIRSFLYVLYSAGIILGLVMVVSFLRRFYIGTENTIMLYNVITRWSVTWMAFTLALSLMVAIYQFRTNKSISARKQLRLVVIGSLFGLITPILYGIFPEFIWRIEHERQLLDLLEMTNGIGTYIMTTFLVVAIFRYRIWNLEIFVREAIFYFIATAIILLCYVFLLLLMNLLMIEVTALIRFILLAFSTAAFLFLRDHVQRFIDIAFYRSSYDSTKVVEEFEKQYAGIFRIEILSAMITDYLRNIFHSSSIILAIHKRDQTYRITQCSGLNKEEMVEEFEITKEANFYLSDEKVFSIEEIREKPKIFESCKGELVAPMISGGMAFGMIIVGPKLSRRSYSLQDINLLSLLSKRIVALFKTAELYERDLNNHLRLEEERIRIAKDIHDEVGAKLTRISIMSEGVKNKYTDTSKTEKWLQSIADTSREVIQDMTQIIWALSPKSNTMEGLVSYIRRYTIEYLEPTSIDCHFNLPEKQNVIHLRPETRRNVYLCIKEAINNIVKHSGASKVIISAREDQKWFKILINDNGTGFEPLKARSKGNGLTNMGVRMQTIGGEVKVKSRKGEGTEIMLMIPVSDQYNSSRNKA